MDSSTRKRFHSGLPAVLTRVPRGIWKWAARNPVLLLSVLGFIIPLLFDGRPETRHGAWLTALAAMPVALFYELLQLPGWEGVRTGCARFLRRLSGRGY